MTAGYIFIFGAVSILDTAPERSVTNVRFWPLADLNFNVFWGDRTSAFGKSGLSEFLNVSDTTQAKFAKIPIARVFLGAIQ